MRRRPRPVDPHAADRARLEAAADRCYARGLGLAGYPAPQFLQRSYPCPPGGCDGLWECPRRALDEIGSDS